MFVQSQSQEEVNYMRNQGCQGNYVNFNQGWNSHPSMGQARPSNRPLQQQPSMYERPSKVEETFQQFKQASISNHKRSLYSQFGNLTRSIGKEK